jgi:hypothetical protein
MINRTSDEYNLELEIKTNKEELEIKTNKEELEI